MMLGCVLFAGVLTFHFVYNSTNTDKKLIFEIPPPGTWIVSSVATFLLVFYAYHVDGFCSFGKRKLDAFLFNNRLETIWDNKFFWKYRRPNNQIYPIQMIPPSFYPLFSILHNTQVMKNILFTLFIETLTLLFNQFYCYSIFSQ